MAVKLVPHLAALLCALSLVSCSEGEALPLRERCEPSCFEQRVGCIASRGCRSSADCPQGTTCDRDAMSVGPDPVLAMCSADDGSQAMCRADNDDVDPLTLVMELGVRAFDLHRALDDGTSSVAFSWAPIEDADIMVCALFTCAPEVARTSAEDGPSRQLRRIRNWNKCVEAHQVFEPAVGKFTLDPLSLVSAEQLGNPRMTTLKVGCWASNGSVVVAASLLKDVAPDEVPWAGPFGDCDAEGADGLNCRTPVGSFGTCRAGECRYRCMGARDCHQAAAREVTTSSPDAAAPDGGMPADEARTFACIVAEGAFVGECFEPAAEGP